uniref:DUF4220 domain-containing protein n=1 Tax=Oryza sativa subsp. japonica TaxID=39947 RepID=Q9AV58_ORYSJ|nr:hypothetical protein [Oryza sativa Japonica Group]
MERYMLKGPLQVVGFVWETGFGRDADVHGGAHGSHGLHHLQHRLSTPLLQAAAYLRWHVPLPVRPYPDRAFCAQLRLLPVRSSPLLSLFTERKPEQNRAPPDTPVDAPRRDHPQEGYMTKVMDKYNRDGDGRSAVPANDMSNCKFVVMGRRVVVAGGGHQHQATYCNENEQKHLHLCIAEPDDYSNSDSNKEWPLVTVKTIWEMREKHKNIFHGKIGDFLEDLCLSFSLFKMLRRQFEHYPMVEVGSDMARAMMLDGLLKLNFSSPGSNSSHDQLQRPFQVLLMELELLKNYYQQAAAPVVMSQPILFCTNFLSSIIFLYFFIDAVVDILIVNKDAAPLYCRIMGWGRTPVNSPSLILSLTMLLVLTVILIEAHDFLTSHRFQPDDHHRGHPGVAPGDGAARDDDDDGQAEERMPDRVGAVQVVHASGGATPRATARRRDVGVQLLRENEELPGSCVQAVRLPRVPAEPPVQEEEDRQDRHIRRPVGEFVPRPDGAERCKAVPLAQGEARRRGVGRAGAPLGAPRHLPRAVQRRAGPCQGVGLMGRRPHHLPLGTVHARRDHAPAASRAT